MKHVLLATIAALAFNLAAAVEVAGVKFDDKTRVGTGELVVNGAGVRKKAIFKVYAMALYLPAKTGDAAAALTARGAKRISIVLLRDLSAKQFVDALQEGMASNHSDAEMGALKDRLQQFSDAMLATGEAKSGSSVLIDWLPESGTRLTVNGQAKGKDIAGEDFYRALLAIWLGNKPVQDDLKQELLGKSP
ncbi:MAG TPA: chalcone isomerase family protein [Accumulibacter sp.]|uniref:chalcone isomerase family protein n=1 Tax=Accumulibacter sp. TaxID=2053492 RepID=UPI0025E166A6|nr:chalcone isomerase family protein [Accumulibacter sp.]MCM8597414.1 chalcone isomerase family protein [Accumulibacter sp.]MCM8664449.1 chalcone isomerase family protein [Accumulibacter sp.]HNC52722.1 chalcone isomerase family protein [Accumulibacter sp.]